MTPVEAASRQQRLSRRGQNQRSRTGPPAGYIQSPARSSIHLTTRLGSQGRRAFIEPAFLSTTISLPPGRRTRRASAIDRADVADVLERPRRRPRRRTTRPRTAASEPSPRTRASPHGLAEHRVPRGPARPPVAPRRSSRRANRPLPQPRSSTRGRSRPAEAADERLRGDSRYGRHSRLNRRDGVVEPARRPRRRGGVAVVKRPSAARDQLAVLEVPDGDREARERAEGEALRGRRGSRACRGRA